jgi:hypothetical protein
VQVGVFITGKDLGSVDRQLESAGFSGTFGEGNHVGTLVNGTGASGGGEEEISSSGFSGGDWKATG